MPAPASQTIEIALAENGRFPPFPVGTSQRNEQPKAAVRGEAHRREPTC